MSVKASVKKYSRMRIKITSKIQSIVPWSKDYLLRTFHESSYTHGVIGQDPAIWAFWIILVIDRETDRQNNAREDITVQSSMSGSPVAVRAGVSLLGRWLLPRVRQHSALSAVSWRSDLRGTANTQQLRRHRTFAVAGPRLWNSLPGQLRNPDITYGLFIRQPKAHLFREAWTRRSVTSDMRHLRKLTYLLTYCFAGVIISYQTWLETTRVIS